MYEDQYSRIGGIGRVIDCTQISFKSFELRRNFIAKTLNAWNDESRDVVSRSLIIRGTYVPSVHTFDNHCRPKNKAWKCSSIWQNIHLRLRYTGPWCYFFQKYLKKYKVWLTCQKSRQIWIQTADTTIIVLPITTDSRPKAWCVTRNCGIIRKQNLPLYLFY